MRNGREKDALRIGVNALYMIPGEVGGTEIYLREVLESLAKLDSSNQYFLFVNRETQQCPLPVTPNFHLEVQNVQARSRVSRILWEQTVLPLRCAALGIDVLFNPGYTAPLMGGCPQVTVFHDLQHRRHPENFSRLEIPFWRFFLWASVRRSERIVAISESTRADLLKCYRVEPGRVEVVHHGVDQRFFDLERKQDRPFWLCVSAHRPNKNLGRLVSAFARHRTEDHLVLAGPLGVETERIEKAAVEHDIRDRIEITGWISETELDHLYGGALGLIAPTLFEGFGLPVLEAMASGLPVACSDIPPHREIAGDAACFFDPQDEKSMAAALDRVANDAPYRQLLVERGRLRARNFRWSDSAGRLLKSLEMAVQTTLSKKATDSRAARSQL